jgi:hypothetical protein
LFRISTGVLKVGEDEVINGVPVRKHEPPEVEEIYLDDDATVILFQNCEFDPLFHHLEPYQYGIHAFCCIQEADFTHGRVSEIPLELGKYTKLEVWFLHSNSCLID